MDHVELLLTVKDGVQFELGKIGVAEHAHHRFFLPETRSKGGEGCIDHILLVNASLYS